MGTIDAEIAVVADYSWRFDIRLGKPLVTFELEWTKWVERLGLDPR